MCDISSQAFTLGEDYSNTKLVRKVIRSLPEMFSIKVTTIEKAKDLERLAINELLGSLHTFEMNLDDAKRGRIKGDKTIAFQGTKVVPTSSNVTIKVLQEQIALLTQNFNKAFKKQIKTLKKF